MTEHPEETPPRPPGSPVSDPDSEPGQICTFDQFLRYVAADCVNSGTRFTTDQIVAAIRAHRDGGDDG